MNAYIWKKKKTYEEETGPTGSIRIQGNNVLDTKKDELEGKTDDASHESFTEQASKTFHIIFLKQ